MKDIGNNHVPLQDAQTQRESRQLFKVVRQNRSLPARCLCKQE